MTIAEAISRHTRESETTARMFSEVQAQRAQIYDNRRTLEADRREIETYFDDTDKLINALTEFLKHDRELFEMMKTRLKCEE